MVLWSRVFRTSRYLIQLDLYLVTLWRTLDDGHAARIVLPERDGLIDLSTGCLDLSRCAIDDDVAMRRRIIVERRVEAIDTCLDVVVRELAVLVNQHGLRRSRNARGFGS